jgi:anthranilate phosphoribosyltransferase
VSVAAALKTLAGGKSLTRDAAAEAFLDLMERREPPSRQGALLGALAAKGETPDELAGAVGAVRSVMRRVRCSRRPLLDTCGPGGNGGDTVNVSTGAAIVCAGAGAAVAKHGNRSATSRCGSADVAERLGIPLERTPEQAEADLDENGFAFLFAPAFHPAMREVAPVRRELGFRTIFNLIGPLANPAGASHQLIGVGDFATARLLAESLALLGSERAVVFHSENGLGELTPGVSAIGFDVRGGRSAPWRFDPGVLAQAAVGAAEIRGGGAEENARILRAMLDGEPGPVRETVLLNAAAALWTAEAARTLHDAYAMAAGAVDSGRARAVLEKAARK